MKKHIASPGCRQTPSFQAGFAAYGADRLGILSSDQLWKEQIPLLELVGRQVVQAAVRSERVVMALPCLDDHRSLAA